MKNIYILNLILFISICFGDEIKNPNEHNIFKKGIKNPDGTYPEGVTPEGVYRGETLIGYDNNKNSVTIKIEDNLFYQGNKLYTGYLIDHYNNGDINFEGNITNGKKDGFLKGYYNNNQIGYEVNYKNGIKHGKHTMYFENGNLFEEGNYIDGKEEGTWITIDSSGYINRGNYKNGKREGIWDWYSVNSETSLDTIKFEEEFFEKGILKGKTERFIEDNKLIYMVTNYSHHENGKIHLEEQSIEGVKNKSTFYYENGQKSSENSYTYINGDEHSKWIKYYENGEIQEEGKYINGKENGEFILYEDGRIIERHNYKNGQLDGKLYTYYENGKVKFELLWENGEINDNSILYFNEDGQLIEK